MQYFAADQHGMRNRYDGTCPTRPPSACPVLTGQVRADASVWPRAPRASLVWTSRAVATVICIINVQTLRDIDPVQAVLRIISSTILSAMQWPRNLVPVVIDAPNLVQGTR